MIRILHIVSSLSTGSGVMSFIMSYHRYIDKAQIQFDYLSFRNTENTFEDEIHSLGGRVYHISKPSFSKTFRYEMEAFFLQHAKEYPIIHCHPVFASAIFAPVAKKYGVKNIIQHSHTTEFGKNRFSSIRNIMFLMMFGKNATQYVSCSEAAKHVFFWKKKQDIFLIPNAIDFEKFEYSSQKRKQIRSKLGLDEDCVIIGHVGRFVQQKNHEFLLRIFELYHNGNSNSRLLLIGDGVLMDKIHTVAENLGIGESVIFMGRCNNVSDYLSAMDIFILPSTSEGLGIVLLEAQASGLHCLASDIVPRESNILGAVTYLPLKCGPEIWVDKIINSDKNRCSIEKESVLMYDIHYAAHSLEKYYFSICNK